MIPKIALLVEDSEDLRRLMTRRLTRAGLTVFAAADGESAICQSQEKSPDIVFIDYRLPDMTGVEVVRRMKQTGGHAQYVALTGMNPADIAEESTAAGICQIAQKPLSQVGLDRILTELGGVSKD